MARQDPGDSDLQGYLARVGRLPLLDREQEQELTRAYRDRGDHEARDKIIVSNLRLVVSVAKRFQRRGLPLVDLVEEGNLGLIRAVERFDPDRGTRFSTLAIWWIERAIRRALYNSARTVRIPAYMFETIARAKETAAQLEAELGRPPRSEEVAAKMNLKRETALLLRRAMRPRPTSLSTPVCGGDEDGGETTLGMLLEDRAAPAPDETVLDQMERETLHRMIESIDQREAEILSLRYGLDHEKPRTLHEIGEMMGLSRERVRQLEARALKRLREALNASREPPTTD